MQTLVFKPIRESASRQTMEKPRSVEWKNSLKQSVWCTFIPPSSPPKSTVSHQAQEAVVAVFRFAKRWTLSLLQMFPGCTALWGYVCVFLCVCVNGPEASIGVADCPYHHWCLLNGQIHTHTQPTWLGSGLGPVFLASFFSLLWVVFLPESTFFSFLVNFMFFGAAVKVLFPSPYLFSYLSFSLGHSPLLLFLFQALFRIFHSCYSFLFPCQPSPQKNWQLQVCGWKLTASFPHTHSLRVFPMQTIQTWLHSTYAFISPFL